MSTEKITWDFRDVPYGPDPLQKFDMACKKKGNVHAIIHIHGGAFFSGSRAQYPSFLAHYAKDNLVATIDYRVISPDNDIRMTDILSDIDSALSAMINTSGAGGIEICDFVLIGHSAGGHLMLMYAYGYPQKNAKVKIAACVSMAGPTDFSDDRGWPLMPTWGKTMEERLAFYSWMGSRLAGANVRLTQSDWTAQSDYPEMEKHVNAISPVAFVSHDSGLPPTLLIHGREDDQVPYTNAVILKRALDDAGVPNKLITPEGDGSDHLLGGKVGQGSEPVSYQGQAWVDEAIKWLGTYTFTFENIRQKMMEAFAKGGVFPFNVPAEKWDDKDFCIEALGQTRAALRFIPGDFWDDKDFCLKAIGWREDDEDDEITERRDKIVRYIPQAFWLDADFCLEVIVREKDAGRFFSRRFWRNAGFCLAAVKKTGKALEYIKEEMLTPQICQIAVEQDPYALEYVPKKLQTERLIMDAVRRDGRAVGFVSKWLLTREIIEAAIAQNGGAVDYLPVEWREDYKGKG